ncbi:hypothetical protein BH18ACT9_BH18ACT9_15790 [soil metagenome]
MLPPIEQISYDDGSGVPQPGLCSGGLHLRVEGARLNHGDLSVGVDLEGSHAFEADHDALVDHRGPTAQTAAGAARHDRNLVRSGPPHGGLDLAHVLGRTTATGVPASRSGDQSWRYFSSASRAVTTTPSGSASTS